MAACLSTVSLLLKLVDQHWWKFTKVQPSLNSAIFSGFTFTLSFVLVFRTSQCYSRFSECARRLADMRAAIHESAVSLLSATRPSSKKRRNDVNMFVHRAVRLYSLLHACALQCVADVKDTNFPILDIHGLQVEHLDFLSTLNGRLKVDVVYQWIHALMVDGWETGLIIVPAPVFNQVFHHLEKSRADFTHIIQLMVVPFPFPYAQAAKVLLVAYGISTPFVMAFWGESAVSSFIFTFISTIGMFSLEYIAEEIEQPLGEDPNDLPVAEFQVELNNILLLLMEPIAHMAPELSPKASLALTQLHNSKYHRSLNQAIESHKEERAERSLHSSDESAMGQRSFERLPQLERESLNLSYERTDNSLPSGDHEPGEPKHQQTQNVDNQLCTKLPVVPAGQSEDEDVTSTTHDGRQQALWEKQAKLQQSLLEAIQDILVHIKTGSQHSANNTEQFADVLLKPGQVMAF